MSDSLPKRSHPAHGVKITNNGPTVVFLTVCTRGRISWLAKDNVHDELRRIWREARAWQVGKYVIMPDHLHLFAALCDERFELDRWVKYWKSQFSRLHKNANHRWQSDHWDTRMRNLKQFEEKWAYVQLNPVRKGLVANSDEWPHQGTIFDWVW